LNRSAATTNLLRTDTVLLDFSGTLVNDLRPTWLTTCNVLTKFGKPVPTIHEFREMFRLPYWSIFKDYGLSDHVAKTTCLQLYKKLFKKYAWQVSVFADVKPILQTLKEKKLGIVSQTPKKILETFLAGKNLKNYFSKVTSLEDTAEQKPSPLPLLLTAEQLGRDPSEVLYVGDMTEDVIAAKNARMISVAISRKHSYHTYPKLLSSKPDFLISDLRELTSLELLQC